MHRYDPRDERATRDIVSRAIFAEIRGGRTTPNGGVWLSMAHLGPDNVRRQFKGMVERCADCGFDLAAGKVEVVPTAHYMMGGVEFDVDCTTECHGLFVAGEDSGGVHGANRLGGNGVANSTVFGGIAGEAMASALRRPQPRRDPDADVLAASIARATRPFGARANHAAKTGELEALRERLFTTMWDDAGIVRDASGLLRATDALSALTAELDDYRLPEVARNPAFNVTWHDWLNLVSLVDVSKAIIGAALAREDSRGAHFRADFPDAGDLDTSSYTRVRQTADGTLGVQAVPVKFTRVRPGHSLV
jgi:fumarate reductase flavoprotein subunit